MAGAMTATVVRNESHINTMAQDLMMLVSGAPMSQAICVAAELCLPDLLASGPRTVDELARITGAHASSLHRLLRALASVAVCEDCGDGAFMLGSMGQMLRSDVPKSLRSWAIWCGRHMWPIWGELGASVESGKSGQQLAGGVDGFGHLAGDPKVAAAFNAAMVDLTRLIADAMVRMYEFAGIRRIVDVGGGYGALLAVILDAHDEMSGTIFDLPHAVEGAKMCLSDAGIADRCDFITGDFFESVPAGADAYLLKNIVHDWNDERCSIILRNCRQAMPPTGRLLIIEQVAPLRLVASPGHRNIAWTDLAMLLGPGGRQRTEAELCALLASAGLAVVRSIPTVLDYSIIECIPTS
jgi:hypothetical protein